MLMPVSNFNIFCYRTFKKPLISAVWYVLLVYTIWNPQDTLPSILALVLTILSFTPLSIFLGAFSVVPCIVEIIYSRNVFFDSKPTILLIVGIVWVVIWYFGVSVWKRIMNGKYVFDPTTRHLYSKQ